MKARKTRTPHPCKERPANRIAVYVCPTARGRQRGYIPLLYGDCFRSVRSYSVCPRVDIKSGREAEGIVRVVVVDCPVGVHIHEIVGVARIWGTEPPISGDAEYNLITRRIKLAPYRSA